MTNRHHNSVQKQQAPAQISPLPKPRSFSSEMAQGKNEMAPMSNSGVTSFSFSNLIVDTVAEPSSSLYNRSVQAKLEIGDPNDKYEQEADNVAKAVVKQIDHSPQGQEQPPTSQSSSLA